MADNVAITQGSGTTFAADDISSVYYPRSKLSLGADGSATDAVGGAGAVSSAVMRVTLGSDDPAVVALQIMDDWDETDRAKVNIIAGQAGITAGAGAVGASTPRVTLASDDPAVASLAAIDDWDESDRAKVNPIAGQAGVQGGSGTVSALTQRVVLATDVALPAGTNAIGKLAANSGVDIGDVDVTSIAAGENFLGAVGGKTSVYAVTLTTDTAAYASGDLIADTQQMDAFFRKTDGTGIIQSITIIDEEAQGVAFYILFMKTSTSLGTENSAPNISDANLSAGLIGVVSVEATDWITISGTKVASISGINLPVKAVSGTDDLYVAVVNGTGTPDWDADSLVLHIGTLLD